MLQDFAAYVKRQIFRVNNAAHKAKVCRKQFAVVVRDENALYVKLYAAFVVRLIHIERRALRNEEQRCVFLRSFRVGVYVMKRLFAVVTDCFVEFVVVFRLKLAFWAFPKGRSAVYLVYFIFRRSYVSLVVIFILLVVKVNRERDVVGIALDKFFNFPARCIFLAFVVQLHYDCRTACVCTVKTVFFCGVAVCGNFVKVIGISTVA